MQDRQHVDVLIGFPVRHDVGETRDNQLARARNTSRSANLGMLGQEGDRCADALCDRLGGRRTLPGNVDPGLGKVGECLPGVADDH